MPRNKPELTYPIENLEIEVGGRELIINGYAKYELEDQSSGEYGDPSSMFAHFVSLKITNWDCRIVDKKVDFNGLTKQDIKAVEDSILDNLNENFELCEYLASEIKDEDNE